MQQVISDGHPYPSDHDIEGHAALASRDTMVVRLSGSLNSSGDGLVTFLNPHDLADPTQALGAPAQVRREGYSTYVTSGVVLSVGSNGRFTFDKPAVDGDSGGAYLLRYNGHQYVIGTQSGNVDDAGHTHAAGTYLAYEEWRTINNLMETGHTGNISTAATSSINSEPTNLVVGPIRLGKTSSLYK